MPRLESRTTAARPTMPRLTPVLAGGLLLLIPFVASAFEENRCLDPVVTYTNGMPLASSTPLRSHNVYYQCDPDRLGCCGGHYNRPCINSLCDPDDCCSHRRPNAYGPWTQPVTGGMANVEVTRFEQLGSIPNDMILGGPAGAPGGVGGARQPRPQGR